MIQSYITTATATATATAATATATATTTTTAKGINFCFWMEYSYMYIIKNSLKTTILPTVLMLSKFSTLIKKKQNNKPKQEKKIQQN